MDEEKDDKIKAFVKRDKEIPEKINNTFDKFIEKVRNDEIETKRNNVIDFEEKKKNKGIYKFRKFMTVAASLVIVVVASNVYARTQGYDNIFFLIKDLTTPKEENNSEEIFTDRDIIISYKYLQITDNVEMQINEIQIKDNKAKLYLLVKELGENTDTPFNYKVYNEQNETMYDAQSNKKENETIYTEVLELTNYNDNTNELKLEIYNKDKTLIKTVVINLEKKTIEARTENRAVQRISQIELNKFLKKETEKLYTDKEIKDKEIIILETYDIYYNDGKYVAKYLFMMPSEEEFEKDTVEDTEIYLNTVEFTFNNEIYRTVEVGKPEKF